MGAIAPNAKQKSAPKHFSATDPSAYSAAKWAPYDAIDRAAQQYGLTVELVVTGGAPAMGRRRGRTQGDRHQPVSSRGSPTPPTMASSCRRSPSATRARYTPEGPVGSLPRIHFWSLWNEPNFGEDLAPQAIDGSSVSYAPMMYRGSSAPAGTRCSGPATARTRS